MGNERKDCIFRTICKRVPAGAAIGRPESRYAIALHSPFFNSQFSRFFIEEENLLNRLFQQPRGFNRQLGYDMGYKAVEAAVKALEGEQVDSFIDSGSKVVDSTNCDEYIDDMKAKGLWE